MNGIKSLKHIPVLAALLTLIACGGGGGGGGGGGTPGDITLTGKVTTLAGDGTAGFLDASGTAAQFNFPERITSDGTHLYVADTDNHRIRQIVIATGEVTTLAGDGTAGSQNGTGTAARFNGPRGITADGTHLHVADSNNHRIRQIDIATGEVTTLAGDGTAGFLDASGTAAQFDGPRGITADATHLYVADTFNHRIRQIVINSGVVTTLAGDGTAGFLDASGTAAQFNFPEGITADGPHLYVADTLNHRIRQIVINSGVVTTLAGDGTAGFLDHDTGTAAQFDGPRGITADATHLYVADTNNHRIRRIGDGGGSHAGSCSSEPPVITSCTNFIGSIFSVDIAREQCLAGGGSYSTSECAVVNPILTLIGSCASDQGPGTEIIVEFYAPFDPVLAKQGCILGGGTWIP